MFRNSCIKKPSLFHIYKKSGQKVHQTLEGFMDQYPLLLLALLVSVTEEKCLSELKAPSRVKDIANLFMSGLAKETQQPIEADIKDVISNAKIHLSMMNDIFPSDIWAVKLEVTNQLYLNTKTDFINWLVEKTKIVEDVHTSVRPANIDEFIHFCSSCSRAYEGNRLMWQSLTKWVGSVIENRSMKILGKMLPNSTVTDIKRTLALSNTLSIVKMISVYALEDQIKTFCGK